MKKAPKIFRKPIPEKKFHKKIMSRIYIQSDKEFLLNLVTQDSEGKYRIKEDLNKEDSKRLKGLVKSIRKNKGAVRLGKALILIIILAAIVVFNLFFKNRLIENTMESALESAFRAKSDITLKKIYRNSRAMIR